MADDSVGYDLFGVPGSYWGGASAGLGAAGDIYSYIQNLKAQKERDQLFQMLANPAKLSAYVGGLLPQYSPEATAAMNRGINANWQSATGGAPGGAAAQFTADAWAKLLSENWASALNSGIAGLTRAGGMVGQNYPIGQLGGVLKQLMTLRQIGAGGGSQPAGIAGLPIGSPVPGMGLPDVGTPVSFPAPMVDVGPI
jgi:hypothetical protein